MWMGIAIARTDLTWPSRSSFVAGMHDEGGPMRWPLMRIESGGFPRQRRVGTEWRAGLRKMQPGALAPRLADALTDRLRRLIPQQEECERREQASRGESNQAGPR